MKDVFDVRESRETLQCNNCCHAAVAALIERTRRALGLET
jgi:hypothetical protein